MIQSKIRAGVVVMGAFASACLLSGCDAGLFSGPVALQQDNGVIRVAICEDLRADRITIKERNTGIFRTWKVVVSGEGQALIEAGDIFTASELPSGIQTTEEGAFELRSGHEIAVTLSGIREGDLIDAVFLLTEEGVPSDQWLHPDGVTSAVPCPGLGTT